MDTLVDQDVLPHAPVHMIIKSLNLHHFAIFCSVPEFVILDMVGNI